MLVPFRSKSFLKRLKRRSHENGAEDEGEEDSGVTGNNVPVFSESLGDYGNAQPTYIKVILSAKRIKNNSLHRFIYSLKSIYEQILISFRCAREINLLKNLIKFSLLKN